MPSLGSRTLRGMTFVFFLSLTFAAANIRSRNRNFTNGQDADTAPALLCPLFDGFLDLRRQQHRSVQ